MWWCVGGGREREKVLVTAALLGQGFGTNFELFRTKYLLFDAKILVFLGGI